MRFIQESQRRIGFYSGIANSSEFQVSWPDSALRRQSRLGKLQSSRSEHVVEVAAKLTEEICKGAPPMNVLAMRTASRPWCATSSFSEGFTTHDLQVANKLVET